MANNSKSTIRFFYNGIKGSDGALQKGHYSYQEAHTVGENTIPAHITLYGKNYQGFSKEVGEQLCVENNSDSMTDYFEQSRIRFTLDHPLFLQAAAAMTKALAKDIKRCEKKGCVASAKTYRQQLEKLNKAVVTKMLEA